MFDVVASISLTFGTAEDCSYFAPRFCADGLDTPAYDIPLAFQRLRLTFRGWPTHEREAIQNFLLAQWNYVLLTEPTASIYETGGQSLNETCGLLECLALVDSLSPALDISTSSRARSADLRILEFFENLSSSWGGFSREDYQLIATWVNQNTASRISPLLEAASMNSPRTASYMRRAYDALCAGKYP
jgi:hypothetical protein